MSASSDRERKRRMSGMLSSSTGVRLGTIACSWTPRSTSAGMWVEGSLPGAASGIAWIAYTERKNAGGAASSAPYGCDGGETKRVRRMGTLSACTDRGRPAPRRTTEQRLFHTLGAEVLGAANAASSRSGMAERKRARAYSA